MLRFGCNADSPGETQKLSPDRSNDVWLVLAACGQFFVSRMQTVLRLPGNFLNIVGQVLLSSPQLTTEPRTVAVRPGGLYDDSPQVSITCLVDSPSPIRLALG